MEEDQINPAHYMMYGIEAIDILKAKLEKEGMRGYLKGNVFKYVFRVGNKGKEKDWINDIDKAIWYLERLRDEYSSLNV